MVDAAFVSFAVQKLGDFLIQEVSLRKSLREDVKWLRNELFFMQSFLKDAEEKQSGDQRVQQWVFEINSLANDAVAILESYSMAGDQCNEHGFASRLKACTCICRKEIKYYNVGKEIQSLKQRIIDISRKRETYGIKNINDIAGEGPSDKPNNQSALVRTLRRTTSYVDDQDQIFVGFQDVVERLLAELLKAEPRRSLISIYGMGGLGKTTLARNLYTNPNIVSTFQTRAWICVSQEYNSMDLLRSVIKSIQGCTKENLDLLEKMTETDLESHVRGLLEERKYLVVVDDVWQREAWESLKRAFPDCKNGSRVIITTRKEDVAERADNKGFVHKLRYLSQEESWDLFCRKLLDVCAMVPTMEKLARDMVDKCGGLPLAIVVLSGLLSHRRGIEEWEKVKAHLWPQMKDDSIEISYILSLSYNDLPTVLKQCFLCFGIFPEDHVIYAENLVCLWIAEGFIPNGDERMEDVAEGFLNELIRRSLIQVVHTFWEKVTECRIHDLLRDLAIQKALEVNFFDIYDPRKHSISSLCLRHAIHGQGKRYLSLDLSKLKLRSIMFFDPDFCKTSFIKFCNEFQHIYVLHLENHSSTISKLPNVIGSLYHLKFLSLRGTYDLPSSIGNLKNLQTLRVLHDYGHLFQLPPETANLINLRHLVALYSKPLKRISKLTSLQVLEGTSCDQWKDVAAVDLINLRELSMYNIMNSYSLNNISSLKNLSTLRLFCKDDESFPALEFLKSCQKLHKLWLEGRIEKLPLSDPFPNSITMMVLCYSKLMEDPMPTLGMLPNLRNLELEAAYEGKEITCSDNSFSQLEFLRLDDLPNLERWHLATSAMPRIKGLGIRDCPKLKDIPVRMKDVETLKRTQEKQSGDQRVQQWVFEINSVANDAVAILETYSFEASIDDGFASRLKAYACICRKETKFYKVAKEIQSLKQRIMDISRKRETYGITNINNAGEGPSNQSAMVRTLRRTTSYVDEDHIFVGFQDVVERLLAELLKAEPRRSVISIYGMGGLGKTTLARNLYISPNIVSSFPTRSWICVSQEYNTMDLIRNIIKSIQGRTKENLDLLEKMTETDLEIYIRDLLKEHKYLVVVDDVWQREAWESLKRAFPDRNNGSRVIITTRKEDIAERADNKGFVHRLRFLSQEESWDLFCRKLLDVGAMVSAMERLAKDMVYKCRGLPLAIVVLSGLLSHKKGLEEWEKVKTHLWQNIKDDSIEISYILSLSYNDLPTVLKQCFLYFGIFPEDRVISAENIVWLWMAEGFVPRGEERMEDVAEGFLNELIRRSLVQVAETFGGKVTECRIHDLLRDLAVKKALEVNFFDIYDPRNHSISSLCLRHAIHDQAERYLSLDLSNLKLRSIMFFDRDLCKLGLISFRNEFQHIYVLHLEIPYGIKLPNAIGCLYHLKFLSLTGIRELPSSIGNLKNLQTLHANDCERFCQLPPETADLINLRYLVVAYSIPLKRISKLTRLQVLRGIDCDQWKDVDPVDLVNLRELRMFNIKKSYSLNNIGSLKNLSTLSLSCYGEESFPALEFLNSCQKLYKVWLRGRIEKLPLSDLFPNSITMMILSQSKLMEDPMPILGMLPNLRDLDLVGAYKGKEIACSDNSFCQLEFLRLNDLENLERWHFATSAMPLIKGLGIYDCPKLKEIPHRMKDVERLKEFW
ncbi:hypothetical protein HAX54_002545 [Datura stramonium]|uniref:Uncharacterized protein n=1 Tax=Datura stramonium TaxID=4076 RepID=A0ABS8T445_DATST|nr:hypothetical protein [Datura stramonium]